MASQPRILNLGFGGTGHEALSQLKSLFIQSQGKVPPHVGMLYLDTVSPKGQGEGALSNVESVLLQLRDPSEMLRNPENAYVQDWFPQEIKVQTAVHGAAQIRPLGRLALHAQPERLLTQLGNCLDTLTDRSRLREMEDGNSIDEQGSFEVYFLSSLCGGTGSGILIDVATILREQLKNVPAARFIGVFLLPGPFRRRGGTDLVRANAYAALKEIEYLANPRISIEFSFGPNRQFTLDRSPFDLVYLVDSVGERFDTTMSVPQLARQMAYLPYLMSTPSIGQEVREILHNMIPQLETKGLVQGKRATYASFGVATLEIPPGAVLKAKSDFQSELLDQLLQTKEAEQSLDLDTQTTITECRAQQLPDELRLLLLEFDFGNPTESIDRLDQIHIAAVTLVKDYARRQCDKKLQPLRETGERTIERLLVEGARRPGGISSVQQACVRLRTELQEFRKSLLAENKAIEHAENEHDRTWKLCQQAFKSRRRRRREFAAVEWQSVVNNLVLPARFSSAIDSHCADALGFLIDRLRMAEEWCSTARNKLQKILDDVSSEARRLEAPLSPFTRYCDTATLRPGAAAGKFLATIADPKTWLEGSEETIRSELSSFGELEFTPAFVAGGSGSATRIIETDMHNAIGELRRFSDPMWSYATDKIPPAHHSGIHHLEILGVDAFSEKTQLIEGQYPALKVVPTNWWHRSVLLQIRAGVPLFALTCMDELWREYALRDDDWSPVRCHIDKRWAGWPELLPHAFKRSVIDVLARGLAASLIVHSGRIFKYHGPSTNGRVLGESYLDTYRALGSDNQLLEALKELLQQRSEDGVPEMKAEAEKLGHLLMQTRVSIHDRALVEALIHSLEISMKQTY
jgi:hypothetical protein